MNIVRYPVAKATKQEKKQLVQIFHNHNWIVDKEENLLFAKGKFPQCNLSEEIAKSIRDRLYPECEVKYFEFVYIEIRIPNNEWELVPY